MEKVVVLSIEAFDRVAPQNIKTMVISMGKQIEYIDVVPYIIFLLLLFSGFKNRSLSRRERKHPRDLEMVTRITSVHP